MPRKSVIDVARGGIPGTIAREPGGEGPVILGRPDRRMHVEPQVGPGQHARGLLPVEEFPPHEEPEHGKGKPVGARAVRLQAGDAGALAEHPAAIQTAARSRFGIVHTTCRCGTGAGRVVSSHGVQIARRLA